VPADLRLITATELQTIEGELTGESTAVEKDASTRLAAATPLGDQVTMVFSGTTVVNGDGRGLVVATGRDTQVGRVGRMLADVEKHKSPLEERLDDFGTRILWITVALSVALFAIGVLSGLGALAWLAITGHGQRWVWTVIQTCLMLGSIFFATGLLGEQIAQQRSEVRELRRELDDLASAQQDEVADEVTPSVTAGPDRDYR
jgi:magnesium-transporting ATPase (P-type)